MLKDNIKSIRKAKGLSQQELAVKLNVVRQTISKWEQGLSVPDSDMLIAISTHWKHRSVICWGKPLCCRRLTISGRLLKN